MKVPFKLVSTDFDGTIFSEFSDPPIPRGLQELIGGLQRQGVKWAINTGRDMSSLMEALARARLEILPDYLVLVEREIYIHDGVRYAGLEAWNRKCAQDHDALFARVRPDLPRLISWINERFNATIYEDPYSPFCLIAGNHDDGDTIHDYLEKYCREVPDLAIVRNDVYARMAHSAYDKGTALSELARRIGVGAAEVFAAGDHFNDIPMLSRTHAQWLAAPQNAMPAVKDLLARQSGYISPFSHGDGIADALRFHVQPQPNRNPVDPVARLNHNY